MKRNFLMLGVSVLLCLWVVGTVAATDWSLPTFNSLGSNTNKPTRNQPSTLTKMTQGTKDFFSKTYDVLTPWDTAAEKAKKTQNKRPFSNTGRTSNDQKSWFSAWWGDETKPQKPKTVSEWLAQPRP